MDRIDTSTPKKQHYVPQFILKNFKSGKKKRVYVFDKQKRSTYPAAVHDVACENGYYNIELDGKGFTIEGKLASLENVASLAINKIVINENLSCLSD